MPPVLPKKTRFEVPTKGKKKYVAIVPVRSTNGASAGTIRVGFGHRDYQQYEDVVPKSMGGGRWSKKNHHDAKRRRSYRARHGGVLCKNGEPCISVRYSAAWFSYYFLW